MDFRKQQREHPPIHIDGTVVEMVVSLKFLGAHITDKLNWATHTDSVVKKAQQRLNSACHQKHSQTSTDAQSRASCRAASLPEMSTAPPTTVRRSRG